jgi:hypothetical protein
LRIETYPDDQHVIALGAIFGLTGLAAGAVAVMWMHLGLPQPGCYFHALTGFPCPTCGSIRMLEALFQGEVVVAFAWNPLVFSGLAVLAIWAVSSSLRSILRLPALRVALSSREQNMLRLLILILLVTNWGYLIIRGI